MACATRSIRACASEPVLVRLAPKAELHLHFQGAICPATLLGLARRRGVALSVDDLPALREWFRFRDFAHFVEVYALLRACLLEPADYELVTINTDTPAIFGITLRGRHVITGSIESRAGRGRSE